MYLNLSNFFAFFILHERMVIGNENYQASMKKLFNEYLVFEGVSVNEFSGKQTYLDANIAYRNACLNAIEFLKTQGFTGEQAYMLLGSAPVEGHLAGVGDIPNSCCTIALPKDIFTKDILPK